MRRRRAITAEQALEVFAMGQVEAAAARQQELASNRWHAFIDDDGRAAAGQFLARHQSGRAAADHGNVATRCAHPPRTFGMWRNSHGDGMGPTGTSIRVGPSRRLNARLSAARNSVGLRARSASAPKLSAKRTKSGLARSQAIRRLP